MRPKPAVLFHMLRTKQRTSFHADTTAKKRDHWRQNLPVCWSKPQLYHSNWRLSQPTAAQSGIVPDHLSRICEHKMSVDSVQANTEPTFGIFAILSSVFGIFRYRKYRRRYRYRCLKISDICWVFFRYTDPRLLRMVRMIKSKYALTELNHKNTIVNSNRSMTSFCWPVVVKVASASSVSDVVSPDTARNTIMSFTFKPRDIQVRYFVHLRYAVNAKARACAYAKREYVRLCTFCSRIKYTYHMRIIFWRAYP